MSELDIGKLMELYLDANAHLPMSKAALDVFIATNNSLAGHGHALSPSRAGRAAEQAIENAREKIAQLLGATTNQIVFTSTCTQACEWGIEIFNKINSNKHIYVSPTEHPAVRNKIKFYSPVMLGADSDGVVDVDYPIAQDSGVLCIYVQNEVGTIQPFQNIKSDSLFVDMSQAPGKLHMPKLNDIQNLDVAVFGAHKFGGPASVGFIYLKDPATWTEFGSGSRYYMDRAGTPDTAAIVATAAALEAALQRIDDRIAIELEFKSVLEPALEELGFVVIGKDSDRVSNTTFVRVPDGKYSQFVMMSLSKRNIHVGLGSACGAIHTGSSPLMKILSRTGDVGNYIRISQNGEYGKDEAKYLIKSLKEVLH